MNIFHCKSLKVILLLIVSTCLPSVSHGTDYQCDVNDDHRLGLEEAINYLRQYSGANDASPTTVLDCGDPSFEISESGDLNTAAKSYILCRSNEIRSEVALGTVADNGQNGSWPIATNMQRLMWDNNLATVAQNYASQCNYGHNASRGDQYATQIGAQNAQVGENIAAKGISWTIDSTTAVKAIDAGFSGWNGENDLWYYDTINSNSWASGIGHFTQNVWAETTMVGCGQAWCPDGWPGGGYNMIFTVCNYYSAGNMITEHPYETGSGVCSEDMFEGDSCSNGLIKSANYQTGIDYECDTDGDMQLGLEEIINALQITTGQTP